jgi:stage III sporulation protein AB
MMLEEITMRLRYCNASVSEILCEISGNSDKNHAFFAKECAVLYEKGEIFPQAWQKSISACQSSSCLQEKEIGYLLSFGERLGTTDLPGQLAICSLYKDLFAEALAGAKKNDEKYSKLCARMGILSAVLFAVIFF